SSGKPVFDAINKYDLKDVIVIVTRYFGGVKLGVGGLKRAYFEAAEECLKSCKIREIIITETLKLSFSYAFISQVMNYLEKSGIKVMANNSGEKAVIECDVRLGKTDEFRSDLTELTNGSIKIENA
ncbi:MAG: YigZ family protein, partial [Bacteroidetes bacterium]|nr:YigZ family protein [Bacteroidota bacterium]